MADSNTFSAAFDAGTGRSHKKKGSLKNLDSSNPYTSWITTLHKGGSVRKTGNYRLRKGEIVLTREQQKAHGITRKSAGKRRAGKRVARKD